MAMAVSDVRSVFLPKVLRSPLLCRLSYGPNTAHNCWVLAGVARVTFRSVLTAEGVLDIAGSGQFPMDGGT